jgi:hypothetical protein
MYGLLQISLSYQFTADLSPFPCKCQSAAAGGLYNLVTAADRKMLEDSQVVEIMRRVPISRYPLSLSLIRICKCENPQEMTFLTMVLQEHQRPFRNQI